MNRTTNLLIDRLTIVAGISFVVLAFLTAAEVLARKLLNLSLMSVDEYGGYIYAIGSAIGFAAAYVDNSHIRVDLVVSRLSAKPRLVINLASHALLAAFILLLTWRAGAQLLQSWHLDASAPTPMRTPLIYPQGMWFAALALFLALILARLAKALTMLRQGAAVGAASALLDVAPPEAELESELSSLAARQMKGRKP